ncbi:hypothetical protein GQR58_030591 [Nymphon striatum]|nr:hypothetical protein GQR58_030591 [Nymphon striatum]
MSSTEVKLVLFILIKPKITDFDSIKQFDEGKNRILVTTDVMARGLDLDKISHVINFDTPSYPENYMHRIGRTGRSEEEGTALLFYTEKEKADKEAIETLMKIKIAQNDLPDHIEISERLTPAETPKIIEARQSFKKARRGSREANSLIKVSGQLSRPSREEFARRKKDAKKAQKRKKAAKDRCARKETGIRSAREASIFVAPKLLPAAELSSKETAELESPRNCYVCKTEFTKLHHFYDTMCSDCGDFNYAKRFQTADLKGQVAVITGSRLKIGYHISLMLLRAGVTVVATTRFPVDSAIRFSKEEDFTEWGHRLKIHGLDLRHIPSVEIFCNYIEQKYDRLDILINNAAQTVRRPAGFYSHLMPNEEKPISELPKYAADLLKDHLGCLNELKVLTSSASPNQNMPVTLARARTWNWSSSIRKTISNSL